MIPHQALSEKEKGNDLYQKKKFLEAAQHYTAAIDLFPSDMVFYLNRAGMCKPLLPSMLSRPGVNNHLFSFLLFSPPFLQLHFMNCLCTTNPSWIVGRPWSWVPTIHLQLLSYSPSMLFVYSFALYPFVFFFYFILFYILFFFSFILFFSLIFFSLPLLFLKLSIRAWFRMGQSRFKLQYLAECIEAYRKSIELNPASESNELAIAAIAKVIYIYFFIFYFKKKKQRNERKNMSGRDSYTLYAGRTTRTVTP